MAFRTTSSAAQNAVARLGVRTWTRVRSWVATLRDHRVAPQAESKATAVMLAFPTNGYGNLIRLERSLKARFASLGITDYAPFILKTVPGAMPRLWLDANAFVEFCHAQRGYRFVFDNGSQSRITFESNDFASVESLIGHYIYSCFMGGSEQRAAR
jgi:hypothetical protein